MYYNFWKQFNLSWLSKANLLKSLFLRLAPFNFTFIFVSLISTCINYLSHIKPNIFFLGVKQVSGALYFAIKLIFICWKTEIGSVAVEKTCKWQLLLDQVTQVRCRYCFDAIICKILASSSKIGDKFWPVFLSNLKLTNLV